MPAETRLVELRRAAPPIVLGQRRHAFFRETLCQQTGLHGAVADDPSIMARTPGNVLLGRSAIDQRKRRLQRVHMPDRLAPLAESCVEVRYACRADLSLLDELHHFDPGILDPRTCVRPVELIQIDARDTQPPERRFASAADRIGATVSRRAL